MSVEIQTKVIKQKKRNMTSFEIGDLKEPWREYCEKNRVTSVDIFCRVIQNLIASDSVPENLNLNSGQISRPIGITNSEGKTNRKIYRQIDRRRGEGVEKEERKRLYLRLTKSERAAVDEQAKADGFDEATQWAIAVIRARLTNHPQFNKEEIRQLGESNYQLLAVGRNLNQIAHALNVWNAGRGGFEYDAKQVDDLAKALKKHVQKVGDALRASIHRWRVE